MKRKSPLQTASTGRGFANISVVPEIDPKWHRTFSYVPSGPTTGKTLASFVRNVLDDGHKKLGVIHANVPINNKGKDAYVAEAKALGMQVVAVEAVERNQSSFTPQLLRLRNAGVENLAIIATVEALGILRDAKAIGYTPRFTGFFWGFDFITQAAGPTATGATTLRFVATIDTPEFKEFEAKQRQYRRSNASDGESFLLYAAGLLGVHALESAGPAPTVDSLLRGIQGIEHYDNRILSPITYGPGDLVGPEGSFPAECCSSENTWKRLGPAQTTFQPKAARPAQWSCSRPAVLHTALHPCLPR